MGSIRNVSLKLEITFYFKRNILAFFFFKRFIPKLFLKSQQFRLDIERRQKGDVPNNLPLCWWGYIQTKRIPNESSKQQNVALSLFMDGSGKCKLPSTAHGPSSGLSRIHHLNIVNLYQQATLDKKPVMKVA